MPSQTVLELRSLTVKPRICNLALKEPGEIFKDSNNTVYYKTPDGNILRCDAKPLSRKVQRKLSKAVKVYNKQLNHF